MFQGAKCAVKKFTKKFISNVEKLRYINTYISKFEFMIVFYSI